jgi:glycosyltransferase involved in cell wall biosynthesis
MRVLVNCLSIGSLSGQHVVFGFLARLVEWTRGEHEWVLLHDESATLPDSVRGPHVALLPVSSRLRSWAARMPWEAARLPALLRRERIDLLLNPSGALLPGVPCPQVVLCQNPWGFVPRAHRNWRDRSKAALQRVGYRRAFRSADLILFISDHLRSLYRAAAGPGREATSDVAHVGIDDETFAAADRLRDEVPRDDRLILSVSAMAHWKGTETLVSALRRLLDRGVSARLRLVGPWPDAAYESQIRSQIASLNLHDAVEIAGQVTKDQLHRSYAQARVFALLSHCESFGIPAAEAQAFGAPAVVSTGCAMPEVCGPGALAGPPGDVDWTADSLERLLTSNDDWSRLSRAALDNSRRFHWEETARPFLRIFDLAPRRAERAPRPRELQAVS